MFGLGFGELLIILVIVLLLFGSKKLPMLGEALGKSINSFKRGMNSDQQETDSEKNS